MSLTLTITRHNGPLPAGGASRAFGGGMVTIGRGDINDWVLPDPERLLSKRHCVINFRDGQFSVMDTSTNGLFVNGASEPLGRGNSAVLSDGDRLELGDYEISVGIEEGAALVAGPDDPFADLLDHKSASPQRPAPTPASSPQAVDAPFGLPRNDPFHDPLADPWRPEHEAKPAITPSPFATPGAAPFIPEDDDLFGPVESPPPWRGGSQDDHLPSHEQAFRPPSPVIPDDWESDFAAPASSPKPVEAPPAAPAPPPPEVEPPRPAAIPETTVIPGVTSSAAEPVAPVAPAPPPAQPAAPKSEAPPRAAVPVDRDKAASALASFLAGAGLEEFDPGTDDPDALLRQLGAVFRDMAEGLREVLQARATIKNEFRVERTMIGAADNNPLKFSPGGDEMLRLLLQPRPGYMKAERAVRDGIDDVKAHQMATMAGMQAAVDAVLAQFDPENLKTRFDRHSLVDKLLPGARKARYWDLYEDLYREILKEIRDSFLGLFGREFARAYEEQMRKL